MLIYGGLSESGLWSWSRKPVMINYHSRVQIPYPPYIEYLVIFNISHLDMELSATLTQLVEYWSVKPRVVGPSPTSGVI